MRSRAPAVGAPAPLSIEELYRSEWGVLVRVAYLLTGSEFVAEEMVQDAFVRLQGAQTEIRNPGAYLHTSVVNACRSHRRHRVVVERTVLPRPDDVNLVTNDLMDSLGRLSWRERAVVVLRYYIGFSEVEIADVLECRPGTVRSLSFRALRKLRKELE